MREPRRSDAYKLLKELPAGYPLYYLQLRTSRSGASHWVKVYIAAQLKGERFPSIEPINLHECRLYRIRGMDQRSGTYRVTDSKHPGQWVVQSIGLIVHDSPHYFEARNLGEVSVLYDILKFGIANITSDDSKSQGKSQA